MKSFTKSEYRVHYPNLFKFMRSLIYSETRLPKSKSVISNFLEIKRISQSYVTKKNAEYLHTYLLHVGNGKRHTNKFVYD